MSASTCRAHALPATGHTGSDTAHPRRTAPPHRFPSLTTTVPKEFVHRASIAEVLLTDWERLEGHRFTVGAQWPRGHSFYTPVNGCHDPLIAAETIRQTGLLLAHAEFGVPLDHHLLVGELDVTVRPRHLHVGWTPATLRIDVTCTQVEQRRGTLTRCRVDVEIHRDGHLAATGGGSFTCIGPKIYRRLRATRLLTGEHTPTPPPTPPQTPRTVGRTSPADVVLTPTPHPRRWHLRIDTRHPVLFDHPLDHVPGMLLLEAARQATTATLQHPTPTLPLSLTSQFTRYVEIGTPTLIEAHPLPTPPTTHEQSIHITAHQNGTPAFHATVTMATPTP